MNRTTWIKDFVFISLISLASAFSYNLISTGMPLYIEQIGGSDLTVGLAVTLLTISSMVIRPFSGIMLDRFGHKTILLISVGYSFIIVVAYAIFPLIGFVLALRMLHGAGWSVFSTSTSTITVDITPPKRLAEMMGYFALFPGIASVVGPALANHLMENAGFVPLALCSAAFLALTFVFALFQPSRSLPKPDQHMKPDFSLKNLFNKTALLPTSITFLLSCAFASIMGFILLHGKDRGVENIYLFLTTHSIVNLIVRPLIGKLSDRIGFFIPVILTAVSMIFMLLLISISDTIILFLFAAVLSGFAMGAGVGTLHAMAVTSVPKEKRGQATSTFLFGADTGISLGAIIAGAIANAFGYANMYLMMIVFPIIILLIFFILGQKRIARYAIPSEN